MIFLLILDETNLQMNRYSNQQKDIYCHNCNYPLQGEENFCPNCGQRNNIKRLNIKQFINTFINNFINFDSGIWLTIIHLIRYPGKVPYEYIKGKRKRYNNPFRLIIQLSIIYLVFNTIENFIPKTENDEKFIKVQYSEKNKTSKALSKIEYFKAFDSINDEIHFKKILRDNLISKAKKDSISNEILDSLTANKSTGSFSNGTFYFPRTFGLNSFQEYLAKNGINYEYYPKIDTTKYNKNSFVEKITMVLPLLVYKPFEKYNLKQIMKLLKVKNNMTNNMIFSISDKFVKMLNGNDAARESYKKSILSKITLGLFFVLPVFSLFLWLFYYKSPYNYTEILVFVFYLQSVYFMVLLFEDLLGMISPFLSGFDFILEIIYFIYLYKSFRFFYKKKKLNTLVKLSFLVVPFYMIITGIGLIAISLISLWV